MLEFDEDEKNAQVLGIYYAKKVGNNLAIEFMSSNVGVSTPEQAIELTEAFWEMVDLSIEDNEHDVSIEGISDLEFWMYKLFNDVSGYISKSGFKKHWDETTKRVKSG